MRSYDIIAVYPGVRVDDMDVEQAILVVPDHSLWQQVVILLGMRSASYRLQY